MSVASALLLFLFDSWFVLEKQPELTDTHENQFIQFQDTPVAINLFQSTPPFQNDEL